MTATPDEPLATTPAASRWGRKAAGVYLAVAALAFVAVAIELVRGRPGLGVFAVSILTAPWSALLAPLARTLQGRVPDAALRPLGLVLALLCALLNARILYGIAARTERDARESREAGRAARR